MTSLTFSFLFQVNIQLMPTAFSAHNMTVSGYLITEFKSKFCCNEIVPFENQTQLIRYHIELPMAPRIQTLQSHFVSGQVLPDVCLHRQ